MRRRGSVWKFVQATLVGGVLFLLPLILAAVLLSKGLQLVKSVTRRFLELMPDGLMASDMAEVTAGVLSLVLAAFLAGLVARTRTGQTMVQWLGNSLLASLPAFNFARGFLGVLDEEAAKTVQVVAVPEGSDWALGLVFQDEGEALVPVFLPGAPDWHSGTLRYCQRDGVVFTDLGFATVTGLARTMGVGRQADLTKLLPLLEKRQARSSPGGNNRL
jgi:uncharacterized membrane protein